MFSIRPIYNKFYNFDLRKYMLDSIYKSTEKYKIITNLDTLNNNKNINPNNHIAYGLIIFTFGYFIGKKLH